MKQRKKLYGSFFADELFFSTSYPFSIDFPCLSNLPLPYPQPSVGALPLSNPTPSSPTTPFIPFRASFLYAISSEIFRLLDFSLVYDDRLYQKAIISINVKEKKFVRETKF